jgi:formylglycine-generating enzyme required for sulfatase activity
MTTDNGKHMAGGTGGEGREFVGAPWQAPPDWKPAPEPEKKPSETSGSGGASDWDVGATVLGRYMVEGVLGSGTLGTVRVCLDEVGGVPVAVKTLPEAITGDAAKLEKARAAFQAAYGLRHPNIAGVRTMEQDGEGGYHVVSDLVEGDNLREWAKRVARGGGVDAESAAKVLRAVAAALDHAHGLGVAHGAVKPENIAVDGDGRVKVLDFALPGRVRELLGGAAAGGAAAYLAPEQLSGGAADAKSDQYALGAVAYELLAGRTPFGPDGAPRAGGNAPNIPGLGRGAMAALRRAMAKKPEKRFASCGDFVAALAGEKVAGVGGAGLGAGWWIAAAAVFVAAALAGAGVWWRVWQAREEAAREEAARLEAQVAALARQEAWRLEEERRMEEARQAAEEEALRVERMQAEREERIRRENEELEETVYRLAPLARTKAENARKMRYDRGQGFGAKLDEAQEKLERGEAAMLGRNFGKAKEWFEESMAAADWCEENAPLREAAANAGERAEWARREAEALAGQRKGWKKAQNRRNSAFEEAERAWKDGRFAVAERAWIRAREICERDADEARRSAERAKMRDLSVALDRARAAAGAERWEDALRLAEKALSLEPEHGEASRLWQLAADALQSVDAPSGREETENPTLSESQVNPVPPDNSDDLVPPEETMPQGGMPPVPGSDEGEGVSREEETPEAVPPETQGGVVAQQETARENDRPVSRTVVVVASMPSGAQAGEMRVLTLPGGATMELVWCPPGTFTMGSPPNEAGRCDDEPQHRVTLTKGFWMARTEVTQRQWRSVMGNNPSQSMGDDFPVECVTWVDCKMFCRKAGLELPTEAEWEYACRAGNTGGGGWPFVRVGWFGGNGANAWGLCDMDGNVWEWCADWYGGYPGGAVTDPTGPASGRNRAVRGGGDRCRPANREERHPGVRDGRLGFRPVRRGW